jgi:CRP-like cAMP-binding protein
MNAPAGGSPHFLDSLDEAARDDLRAHGIVRRFPRTTALFHQDQLSDRAVVLLTGFVKLCSISDDGREVVLAIRGPGDLIGELGALDGRPRCATAIALEDVSALAVPSTDFKRFLTTHPQAALDIISELGARLRDADRKRVEFTARDSMSRVAARVLELAERFGETIEGAVQIELPISQEELAGWTGCSRDSVVKALQALRRLGWIETRRKQITVRDLEALRRQAGWRAAGEDGIPSAENSLEAAVRLA